MKSHFKNPADFTITACTIVKNEEKNLAASIASYKEYVDEIVVVDTGSTDGTVEIARDLGAKVLHFEWCDDFSAAKNVALDAATGDWIVFLDADERFFGESCENLRAVILEAKLREMNAVGCRLVNIDEDDGDAPISDIFSVRVFEKGARYRNPIHEEIYNTEGLRVQPVGKKCFYLLHTGYSGLRKTDKCRRNLDVLLQELETADERRAVIIYSYISDCYYGLKRYDECREYAKRFLDNYKRLEVWLAGCETRPYLNIILSLEAERAAPEEIEPFIAAFERDYPCADADFAVGRSRMRGLDFRGALEKFDEAEQKSQHNDGTLPDAVSSQLGRLYNHRGLCLEGLCESALAMDSYFKAFTEYREESAAYNLLRMVRQMPRRQLDDFARSLYRGAPHSRHIAVLGALMCNYMALQLTECYAAYRAADGGDTLQADISAFIKAGEGDFAVAANLFSLCCGSHPQRQMTVRFLVCAVLSGDEKLIGEAAKDSSPAERFAMGLAPAAVFSPKDILDISDILVELHRIGQEDFLEQKLTEISQSLGDDELLQLSGFLAESFAFKAALIAAKSASISAHSVFLQGYCLWRLGRRGEAAALLRLAKSLGKSGQAVEELIRAAGEKSGGLTLEEKERKMSLIEEKLAAGDLDGADREIDAYLETGADGTVLSARSALLYYRGDCKGAAIAAECGLTFDENNFDLLYNAGCAYRELGDTGRAGALFRRALENCGDSVLRSELTAALGVPN